MQQIIINNCTKNVVVHIVEKLFNQSLLLVVEFFFFFLRGHSWAKSLDVKYIKKPNFVATFCILY